MKNRDSGQNKKIPLSFAEHEKEQILFTFRNTTPFQRFQWLEETIQLLTPVLKNNQKLLRGRDGR